MNANEKRDVTRILQLAKRGAALASSNKDGDPISDDRLAAIFTQIAEIAKPMDARTGRLEPSARKKPARSGK